MNTLSLPSMQRASALGILAALLAAGWFLVIAPLAGLVWNRQAEIESMTTRLAHLHAVIARKPELERRERTLEAQLVEQGGFWKGSSPAAVAAIVQDRLRQVVTGSGGVVKSTSELRTASEREARIVRVRFRIEGTLETIEQTLTAVETMRPALFTDSLTIVGSEGPTDPARPPLLDLDMEVSGYMPQARS